MRKIQVLVQFIARIVFGKDHISYEANEEQMGEMGGLYMRLKEMLATADICNAEDALHDGFNESKDYLRLVMWFYDELNKMTDEALEASSFSREEIYEGLQDVLRRKGISLPTIL
ncbi:MAG: DUF6483 family protein [Defluviitaleaceae bacterium]|nr:DUF6483 family protein [Defluviitaleaceae bacterium]